MFQSEGGREGFRDCGWDCGVALALPLALEVSGLAAGDCFLEDGAVAGRERLEPLG